MSADVDGNTEIEAFRIAVKASGQPWQQRGVKIVAGGFVVLVAAQLAAFFTSQSVGAIALLAAAVLLIGVGWVCLIVAFVRRRRWARTHVSLTEPVLPDLG